MIFVTLFTSLIAHYEYDINWTSIIHCKNNKNKYKTKQIKKCLASTNSQVYQNIKNVSKRQVLPPLDFFFYSNNIPALIFCSRFCEIISWIRWICMAGHGKISSTFQSRVKYHKELWWRGPDARLSTSGFRFKSHRWHWLHSAWNSLTWYCTLPKWSKYVWQDFHPWLKKGNILMATKYW